ncbi:MULTISPECIES: transmembrane transport protein [unclassified Streptomyces]|uniref:transmembrane transport protein n=1 Tax=unclassified Streptomyces TaxID=2593676 RepID=UPI000A73885F|nr:MULTISPECIES: transmembrane transport protein [unclassified Streptomyces]
MNAPDDTAAGRVPPELERVLAAEVSLRSRMRHVAVGLAGGAGAALLAVLWATEPRPLPPRTQVAFAGLIAVGLAWAAFAGWVLARRRPLFARDRVIGARLALAVAVLTCVAGTVLAAARAGAAEASAAGLAGACIVVGAGVALRRARSRRRALLRLREALRDGTDRHTAGTRRRPGTHDKEA